MPICKPFKKGDKVKWSSQAGGHWKTKRGKIVEVILPFQRPSGYKGLEVGLTGRKEMSFVVETANGYYWPYASLLRRA
jgi:hypothetical protein